MGLPAGIAEKLLARRRGLVERFRRAHSWFERARSARGPQPVPDGLTWNAVYSSRDLLRELPTRYRVAAAPIPAAELLAIATSSYASRSDRVLTPQRRRMASELQRSYLALVGAGARAGRVSLASLLDDVALRSAVINRYDRITGDAVELASSHLNRSRRRIGRDALQQVIGGLVGHQDRRVARPEGDDAEQPREPRRTARARGAARTGGGSSPRSVSWIRKRSRRGWRPLRELAAGDAAAAVLAIALAHEAQSCRPACS